MSFGGRFLKPFLKICCGNIENLNKLEVEDLVAKKNANADAIEMSCLDYSKRYFHSN